MSFDITFYLKKKKVRPEDIKTVEQYNDTYICLLSIRNPPSNLDQLILSCSEKLDYVCYVDYEQVQNENGSYTNTNVVKYEKPEFEDSCCLIDNNSFKSLVRSMDHLNEVCSKYSKRIIFELSDYEYTDLSKKQMIEIKDALFEVSSEFEIDDIYKILRFYRFFDQFFESEIEQENYELIYWRG